MKNEIIEIKGAYVLLDDFKIKKANILIKNKKIEDIIHDDQNIINNKEKNNENKTQIILKDTLIMPGLSNMHSHFAMSLFRGIAENTTLKNWLEKEIWPREKKMNKKDVFISSKISILEMIKNGITLGTDMYFFEKEVYKAVEKLGFRSFLGHGMIDFFNEEKRNKEIKENEKIIKYIKNKNNPLIKPIISPHSPYSCSKELLKYCINICKKQKLPIQIHVSETRKEVYEILNKTKKRPIEYLNDIGFFKIKKILLAHCVYLSKREIEIIAKLKNISVVNNPLSNLKLAGGSICPVYELLYFNSNVCFGTDGPASNNSLDIFQELKMASLLQKNLMWDASILGPKQIINMATYKGYSSVGLKGGKIKKGYLADLIFIDLKNPIFSGYFYNKNRILSSLAYSANPSIINKTMINGKIVYDKNKKKPYLIDHEKILKEFEEISKNYN